MVFCGFTQAIQAISFLLLDIRYFRFDHFKGLTNMHCNEESGAGKTHDVFQTSGSELPEAQGGGTIGQFCEYSEEQVVQQFCEYSVEEQRNFWFLLLLALGVGLRLARVEVRVVVAVLVLVLVGLLLLDVALVLQGLPGEEEHRPGHDALADVVPDLEVSSEQGLRRKKNEQK